jgi:hypothetical protein
MESRQQRERYVYELFVVYLCGWGERESQKRRSLSDHRWIGGISHPDKIVGHVRLLHAQSGNAARAR